MQTMCQIVVTMALVLGVSNVVSEAIEKRDLIKLFAAVVTSVVFVAAFYGAGLFSTFK